MFIYIKLSFSKGFLEQFGVCFYFKYSRRYEVVQFFYPKTNIDKNCLHTKTKKLQPTRSHYPETESSPDFKDAAASKKQSAPSRIISSIQD